MKIGAWVQVPLVVTVSFSQYNSRFPETWALSVGDTVVAKGIVSGGFKAVLRSHLEELGVSDEDDIIDGLVLNAHKAWKDHKKE